MRYLPARGRKAPRVSTRKEVMRSMRSRVPEKSELAAQLKRYRYDAGLKGDEAGAVIGKKATTVYKYEAGTLWVSPGDCLLYTSPSPRDGLLSRMPSSA